MSSGMPSQPSAIGKMLSGIASKIGQPKTSGEGGGPMDRIARLGMSERQQNLNRLWSWYRCQNYATRRVGWDGKETLDPLARETIATQGYVPPGFYDATNDRLPLTFRKPTAPYALVKVIVDRFTGLLFSEQQHPKIKVEGDPATEDFLNAIAEVTRLWQQMIKARTFGGAIGSAAVSFQFVDGKPMIEVHDPRWVNPEFKDRQTLTLSRIEKRYQYPVEIRDPATGNFETVMMWYRRCIDEQTDITYIPVPVGKGEEPVWKEQNRADHGYGFCPVVWVQNVPIEDEIDGDSDAVGIYDLVEAIDGLIAQSNKALVHNCDPTLAILSNASLSPDLKKGSEHSIQIPEGDAKYLEISGSGPKAALELAGQLRSYALEVAQCVLDHPNVANRTAEEVKRIYSSMIAKADVYREQYGERCVKPLLEMIVRAVRGFSAPKTRTDPETGDSVIIRQTVSLPPRIEKDPDSKKVRRIDRVLGEGGPIKLQWGGYFEPSLQDVELAVRAASSAKLSALLDDDTAIRYTSRYFDVEDVPQLISSIRRSASQRDMDLMSMMSSASKEPAVTPEPESVPEPTPTEQTTEEVPMEQDQVEEPTKLQDTALNGAQVSSAMEIVGRVAAKALPRETGVAMLVEFFNIDPAKADRIFGPVGTSFFAEQPDTQGR